MKLKQYCNNKAVDMLLELCKTAVKGTQEKQTHSRINRRSKSSHSEQ